MSEWRNNPLELALDLSRATDAGQPILCQGCGRGLPGQIAIKVGEVYWHENCAPYEVRANIRRWMKEERGEG